MNAGTGEIILVFSQLNLTCFVIQFLHAEISIWRRGIGRVKRSYASVYCVNKFISADEAQAVYSDNIQVFACL